MDLIMSYKHKKRQISVTRNCKELTAMTSVSMVDQRSIVWYVRITCFSILFIYHIFSKLQVFKLNCAGVLEVISSSGWRHLTFNPDEEKIIIQIDRTKSRTENQSQCSHSDHCAHSPQCTHHHADDYGENPHRNNTMYMVAYIMLNEPPGSKYYLPEQFTIKERNTLTETSTQESSSGNPYNFLHGNSS